MASADSPALAALSPDSQPTCPEPSAAPARTAAGERVAAALAAIAPLAAARTNAVRLRLERVLAAFAAERVGVHHFASVSGYGHGDLEIGRAHV